MQDAAPERYSLDLRYIVDRLTMSDQEDFHGTVVSGLEWEGPRGLEKAKSRANQSA